ncbi:MAG: hypothetical protein P8P83_00085 [Rickettsiaceae bacterium]|nr:hypothetical protein [Rickettsiaceae bacterium]
MTRELTNDTIINSLSSMTPLHVASALGSESMVKLLLAHGDDIEAKDSCDRELPCIWLYQQGMNQWSSYY